MSVFPNHRNGHTARTDGTHWSCNCGASGEQPDGQRAQIAAQQHIRRPWREPRVI
jgi:hypothetical protein